MQRGLRCVGSSLHEATSGGDEEQLMGWILSQGDSENWRLCRRTGREAAGSQAGSVRSGGRQIQGSLHCAADGKAVRRFGRDDVLFNCRRCFQRRWNVFKRCRHEARPEGDRARLVLFRMCARARRSGGWLELQELGFHHVAREAALGALAAVQALREGGFDGGDDRGCRGEARGQAAVRLLRAALAGGGGAGGCGTARW